jgi:hypothetical protein
MAENKEKLNIRDKSNNKPNNNVSLPQNSKNDEENSCQKYDGGWICA